MLCSPCGPNPNSNPAPNPNRILCSPCGPGSVTWGKGTHFSTGQGQLFGLGLGGSHVEHGTGSHTIVSNCTHSLSHPLTPLQHSHYI